ncbi:MAG TPA: ASKHA domain-containing protein [Verrucomicrobiae bacterium]|nr:ASKHA domain-containing protein [Verrucomicrobiae bacterium]
MSQPARVIRLSPADLRLEAPHGSSLQDALFAQGVEFPCGGRGRCKGCRIKVIGGSLTVTDEEARLLTPSEIGDGWRLACRHTVTSDLQLELAQWEMPILEDRSPFAFTPRDGLGIAVDVGSTTIVGQLLDRRSGHILAVRSALNAQARHGADVMSRIEFALRGGQPELKTLVRDQIGEMIAQLLAHALSSVPLARVALVGNTVMHHLFCGVNVEPLAHHPFEPKQPGRFQFSPAELRWNLPPTTVEFLPCLSGFVGSDILAGIVATGLHQSRELAALIDLGTNGEIVIGNRDRLLCASTAAGPAFEGARISMGMRAARGAIDDVRVDHGALVCRVIGGGVPRGICGSGLVDAVAAGLELGWIGPNGRMTAGDTIRLADPVSLTQNDVRELQLAKGAIAAGLRILARRLGVSLDDIARIHLAGAFGNYISRASARRIGLLRFPADRIVPTGNTALLGAKRALFEDAADWESIRQRVEHVPLNEDPEFQTIFAAEMQFPS